LWFSSWLSCWPIMFNFFPTISCKSVKQKLKYQQQFFFNLRQRTWHYQEICTFFVLTRWFFWSCLPDLGNKTINSYSKKSSNPHINATKSDKLQYSVSENIQEIDNAKKNSESRNFTRDLSETTRNILRQAYQSPNSYDLFICYLLNQDFRHNWSLKVVNKPRLQMLSANCIVFFIMTTGGIGVEWVNKFKPASHISVPVWRFCSLICQNIYNLSWFPKLIFQIIVCSKKVGAWWQKMILQLTIHFTTEW
jgi:hypothetical protein